MRRRPSSAVARLDVLESRTLLTAALDLIGVTAARQEFPGIDGSGVAVVVIDTGLDANHPRLAGGYLGGRDFTTARLPGPIDENSHGTHVAGTIGGRDDPSHPDPALRRIGVAPDVGLYGFRTGGVGGSNSVEGAATVAALQETLRLRQEYNRTGQGTPVVAVNMSLGGGVFQSASDSGAVNHPWRQLVNDLERAGVTVVATAGNFYTEVRRPGSGAPGIFSTLNVGAVYEKDEGRFVSGDDVDFTTAADRHVIFSARPDPRFVPQTVFAPGARITSTIPGGSYGRKVGTSMAAPHVAGVVALLQEAALQFGGRLLTPDEVQNIVISTADQVIDGDDEDTTVPTTGFVHPRVNALFALREVRRRFEAIAPPRPGTTTGDVNSTLAGAVVVGRVDGNEVFNLAESIGTDAGSFNVGPADVDLFRLDVVTAGDLELNVNSRNGSRFDSFLRLFNANGVEIARNDDRAFPVDLFSSLTRSIQPGTYYVGVSGFPNHNYDPNTATGRQDGDTGDYTLEIRHRVIDPNGIITGAREISLVAVANEPVVRLGHIGRDNFFIDDFGNFVGGTVVGPADVDMFRIPILDNGRLFVDVNTEEFRNIAVDSYLRAWRITDGGLELIGFSDDDPGPGQQPSLDAYLDLPVRRGDEILIGVSAFPNSNYDPTRFGGRSSVGREGFYALFITFRNSDQNGTIPDAFPRPGLPPIWDGRLPSPELLGRIGLDYGEEVGDRDIDFFRVNSPTPGILEVVVDSYSIPDLIDDPVDSVLAIWDAQGNLLAFNDDHNGLDPFLRFSIAANTEYFVSVSGYGNDDFDPFILSSGTSGDTGDYRIRFSLLSNADRGMLINDAIVGGGANLPRLTVGQAVEENIGYDRSADGGRIHVGPSDVDLYIFEPPTSGRFAIDSRGVGNFGSNTVLRLFDANFGQLAFNERISPSDDASRIELDLVGGRTYYVGVSGAGPEPLAYDPRNPDSASPAGPGGQGDYRILASSLSSPGPAPGPDPGPAPGPDPGPAPGPAPGPDPGPDPGPGPSPVADDRPRLIGDYDGDGVADLALYRYDPERRTGVFALQLSNNGTPIERRVEIANVDANVIPVAGDFDGDGKTDVAVVNPTARLDGSPEPNASVWIILMSSTNARVSVPFGAAGELDRPAPADYDGDGITDIATFRADSDVTPGAAEWFILPSQPNPGFQTRNGAFSVAFGAAGGSDLPAPFDFDGDGRADIATFRPVSDLAPGAAQWFILPSSRNDATFSGRVGGFPTTFGAAGNADQPVVADYNGDGRDDVAAFRSVTDLPDNTRWFILPSSGTVPSFGSGFPVSFGVQGVIAAIADYNGDRRPDLAVFDPGNNVWTIRNGLDGAERAVTFNPLGAGAVPVLSPLFFRLQATGNIPPAQALGVASATQRAGGPATVDYGESASAAPISSGRSRQSSPIDPLALDLLLGDDPGPDA